VPRSYLIKIKSLTGYREGETKNSDIRREL